MDSTMFDARFTTPFHPYKEQKLAQNRTVGDTPTADKELVRNERSPKTAKYNVED